jgi:ketosteroid isomerase-like protein
MSTAATSSPPDLVERLMGLWSAPLPDDEAAALDAFRAVYTDPVVLNGTTTALVDLLARARAMQAAYTGLHHELLERVEAPDRLVIAFRLRGTHTGPLPTALGTVAATGRAIDAQVIDILHLVDGRVAGITMVGDELGLLRGLDAVALRAAAPSA